MAKFLIEVPHESEKTACAKAAKLLLATGSHFITNADWGCSDGEHTGWLTVEVGSKEEARAILPVPYRPHARIVKLNKFTINELDHLLGLHKP